MKRTSNMTKDNTPTLTAEQQEIVRRLSSLDETERKSAENDLEKMGAAALPILQRLLESPLKIIKWESRVLPLLGIGGMTLPSVIAWKLGWISQTIIPGALMITCPVMVVLMAMVRLAWVDRILLRSEWERIKTALRVLTQSEEVQAVGLLSEIARVQVPQYFTEQEHLPDVSLVRPAMLRLLPRMSLSDYLALTEHQKNCLYLLLREASAFMFSAGPREEGVPGSPIGVPRTAYDYKLTLSLLQLYARVGDTRGISYIKRLERARPVEKSYVARSVIEAASVTLDGMQGQRPEWQAATTHLRASSTPEATNDELLIPAGQTPPTEEQELLRANTQKDE